jgi:hypothetical protein
MVMSQRPSIEALSGAAFTIETKNKKISEVANDIMLFRMAIVFCGYCRAMNLGNSFFIPAVKDGQ